MRYLAIVLGSTLLLLAGTAKAAIVSSLEVSNLDIPYVFHPLESRPLIGSVLGDVTARVYSVDVNSTTSGCEASDFDFFISGAIAVMKRGSCTFATKALNAANAGAVAAIIFNNVDGLFTGTLGGVPVGIPTIGTSLFVGEGLTSNIHGLLVRVRVYDDSIVNVPEPASLVLLGAALLGFAAVRKTVVTR